MTDDAKCPWCGGEPVFENGVDTTNSYDENDYGDGYIEPVIKKDVTGICSNCGGTHVCEVIYAIPKRRKNGKQS